MPKRDDINLEYSASPDSGLRDPESWERRLEEARARREVVLLQRASKADRDKHTNDGPFSEKGMVARMAHARAEREEKLSQLTDPRPPKGPRLVYNNRGAILDRAARNVSDTADLGGSSSDSAAAGANPTETVLDDSPPYRLLETQGLKAAVTSFKAPAWAEAPGSDTSGAATENVAPPHLVVFPNLPDTVARAAQEMATPATAYPALTVFRRMWPVLLCLSLFCLSGVYYAQSRGADNVVSVPSDGVAPLVSAGAAPGSVLTSAPQLSTPGLPVAPVQVHLLPDATQTYAATYDPPAALQAPVVPSAGRGIDPGASPVRPAVFLSPPAVHAPEQGPGNPAAAFPAQTQPIYFVASPKAPAASLVQQAWFGEWQAISDVGRVSRISVNIPENVPTDRYQSVIALFDGNVLSADVIATTPFDIATTHVRYYHAVDRGAAEELATLFDAEARDFTSYLPSPDKGFLELWISGEGASPVPAVTRSASATVPVTRSARPPETSRKVGLLKRITNALGGLAEPGGGRETSGRGLRTSATAFSDTGSAARGNGSSNTSNGGGEAGSSTGSSGSNAGGGSSTGSSGSDAGGGSSTGSSGGGSKSDADGGSNAGGNKGGSKGGDKGGSKGGNKDGSKGGDKGGSKGGNKGGGKGGKKG